MWLHFSTERRGSPALKASVCSRWLRPIVCHLAMTAGSKSVFVVTLTEDGIGIISEPSKRLGAKKPRKKREFIADSIGDRVSRNQPSALREVRTLFL